MTARGLFKSKWRPTIIIALACCVVYVLLSRRLSVTSDKEEQLPSSYNKDRVPNSKAIHRTGIWSFSSGNERVPTAKSSDRSEQLPLSHGNERTFDSKTSCVLPQLPLRTPIVDKILKVIPPIKCTDEEDWVFTRKGRFYISPKAVKTHGNIECKYQPIVKGEGKLQYMHLFTKERFENGSFLESDAFLASCVAEDGRNYTKYHLCIGKSKVSFSPKDNMFNVFMFGLDSLSRLMLMRLLPKSFSYFTEELNGKVLKGYNILGDGTPAALLPILTGEQELETREMRSGKPGAVHVDEALTFVWKKFEEKGYVTQWGEDEPGVGTYTYRLTGFKNTPVHHFAGPFYLAAHPQFGYQKRYCYGSKPRHVVFLDWLKEGLETNRGSPFFTFGYYTELTHNDNSPGPLCDDDLVKFMQFMKTEGFLDNTIFILMSDHGARHGALRATEQGKQEERLPFLGVYLPESFKKRFPEKTKALSVNTMRLTSPFDVHETFRDILGEFKDTIVSYTKGRGSSLFKEIPVNRTCSDAGIQAHWCSCLQWDTISVSDERAVAAVNKVLNVINNMLMEYNSLCHALTVRDLRKAVVYRSNDQMLKFKKSVDRLPVFTDNLKAASTYIQVTFETNPGTGLFEATVQHDIKNKQYIVNDRDISRLSWYGNASRCIVNKNPRLGPYCVCK